MVERKNWDLHSEILAQLILPPFVHEHVHGLRKIFGKRKLQLIWRSFQCWCWEGPPVRGVGTARQSRNRRAVKHSGLLWCNSASLAAEPSIGPTAAVLAEALKKKHCSPGRSVLSASDLWFRALQRTRRVAKVPRCKGERLFHLLRWSTRVAFVQQR